MTDSEPHEPRNADSELLSFRVAGQEYSVDIMSVREIRSNTKATPLPHSPQHVIGVINLRGTVLPIIDLAHRLNQGTGTVEERAVIIVVHHNDQTYGLLVEAVSDILEVAHEDLQPPPDMATDGTAGMVKALTIIGEKMIRVLDLEAVLVHDVQDAA